MSLTITTKYLNATDTRGSRIKATFGYGRPITVPFDHALSGVDQHWAAALALLQRSDVKGVRFVSGEIPDGYVFVQKHGEVFDC